MSQHIVRQQPSKERFFGLTLGEAAHVVRDARLMDRLGRRIDVRFRNPDPNGSTHILARLFPADLLEIFSVPVVVPAVVARAATLSAVEALGPLNQTEYSAGGTLDNCYIVRMVGPPYQTLSVFKRTVVLRRRKYRVGEKFPGPQVKDRRESLLLTVPMAVPSQPQSGGT